MKKISYILIFVLTFLVTLTVNAKYKEFKAGDIVIINDHEYEVVENSNGSNSKLKVIGGFITISNYYELESICGYNNYGEDENLIKCITEHAVICDSHSDDDCHKLFLPFDTRQAGQDEKVIYDENSETNIGYFFKNKLDVYYKNVMGLTNIKTSMMTADEYINYNISTDMIAGGNIISNYGQIQTSCSDGSWDERPGSSNVRSANPDGTTTNNYYEFSLLNMTSFWINSEKYIEDCNAVTYYDQYIGRVELEEYTISSAIMPVIELEKADLEYALTKEVEGEGTLVLDARNEREYEVGDLLIVAGQPFTVIGKEGEQLELLSHLPVGKETKATNCSDDDFQCQITNLDYCVPDSRYITTGHESEILTSQNPLRRVEHESCQAFLFPYDFDDSTSTTYDPTDENNVGHYVKNELTEELKKSLGINNITVDVLKYQELEDLTNSCILSMLGSQGGNGFPEGGDTRLDQCAGVYSPIKGMYYNYLNSILDTRGANVTGGLTDGIIYPVVTLNYNDLPKYTRAGGTVSVKATPADGYELVELKVTKYENEKVNYTPSEITPIGESNYSFVMPAADTHVFAKFVPMRNRFNALSRTMALVVSEGQNRVAGDKVKFNITLEDGETLEKIVYYDVDNNEIEIEYEKVADGYELVMPEKDVYIEAVIKGATLYGLYGDEVDIPIEKGKAGNVLTFKPKDTSKAIEKITFKNKDGREIIPYFSYANGTYSVIMPEEDVYIELTYLSEMEIRVPKTGDNINRTFIILGISLIVTLGCGYILIKNNKRKSFN
ncbi:MAG: LPXTG cell wall anchor domain-containing protein [Bacilli bacterium]|nr:LPXTG cell wall anchor domain-containing protein [Bacilli bacterium]